MAGSWQQIQSLKKQQIPLILAWDANEPMLTTQMQEFLQNTGLTNIYKDGFGLEQLETHQSWSKKIDHVMASQKLLEYFGDRCIELYCIGFDIDHWPFCFDFCLAEYLKSNAAHIEPPAARNMHSKDPKLVVKCVDLSYNYMEQYNFDNWITSIEMPTPGP